MSNENIPHKIVVIAENGHFDIMYFTNYQGAYNALHGERDPDCMSILDMKLQSRAAIYGEVYNVKVAESSVEEVKAAFKRTLKRIRRIDS